MESNTESGDPMGPPDPAEYSPIDERRSWMRFGREPGTDFASIVHPTALSGWVEIADESLGGLGFVVDDVGPFHVDQELEIAYAGRYHQSQVRHISKRSDGRFTIGVCDLETE